MRGFFDGTTNHLFEVKVVNGDVFYVKVPAQTTTEANGLLESKIMNNSKHSSFLNLYSDKKCSNQCSVASRHIVSIKYVEGD